MSDYSKDDYKEAFRLACHNLILADKRIFGGTIIKGIVDNEIVFNDEYYEEMKETQDMFLKMAKEQKNE